MSTSNADRLAHETSEQRQTRLRNRKPFDAYILHFDSICYTAHRVCVLRTLVLHVLPSSQTFVGNSSIDIDRAR